MSSIFSAAPSAPPQNFTVEVLSSTVVFLRWAPPKPDQQNGVIRIYLIRQYETNTDILTNYTQEENRFEMVIGSLRAHNQYQFTIAAETVKLGPFSSPVAVTTLESGQFVYVLQQAGNVVSNSVEQYRHKMNFSCAALMIKVGYFNDHRILKT